MHPDEETLDSQVLEDDQPEPELQGDAVEAENDVQQTDSEIDPLDDLPAESFEADPEDTHGAEDHPEDS